MPMNRNSSSTCGRKTSTLPTPRHAPSTMQRASAETAGSVAAIHLPLMANAFCAASEMGAAAMKMVRITPTTTSRKSSGPATGCRTTASRRRVHLGAIGGRYPALLPTPPAHSRHFGTSCRTGSRVGSGLGHGAGQKIEDLVDVFAAARADQRHRRAEFVRELAQIQFAAAIAQIVGHVQDDQRGQAQRQNRRRQHQVAPQVGGIQNQQHGFRLGRAGARRHAARRRRPARLRSAG